MEPIDQGDPFLVPLPSREEVPHDAPEGSYTYELVPVLPGAAAAEVETTDAARAVAAAPPGSARSLFYIGLSAALHLGVLAASAVIVPLCLREEVEYDLTLDQRQLLSRLLATADANEIERREAERTEGDEGGTGTRTRGEEGTMGSPSPSGSSGRPFIEPPDCPADDARAAALRDAAEFAVITLRANPGEWVSPWSRDDATAHDAPSARCEASDPFVAAALPRLSGLGDGDDARGAGPVPGLGSIGVLGPATRTAPRRSREAVPFFGSVPFRRPKVRAGTASVSGRLPAEVIQRVLRSRLGRVRQCYENGLRHDPTLQGRVAVRFVIGRDGSLSRVGNAGSDFPDHGVVTCVVRAYYGLDFPQPESGVVTVVYPIVLGPGG